MLPVKTILRKCDKCGVFTLSYRVRFYPKLTIMCVGCSPTEPVPTNTKKKTEGVP